MKKTQLSDLPKAKQLAWGKAGISISLLSGSEIQGLLSV